MATITFTQKSTGITTNLLDSTVRSKRIDGIESSPDKDFNTVKIARRDGEKKISDTSASRPITFEGNFYGTTADDFRTNMDRVKRDVQGPGYLDVTFDGSLTRRYYVEVRNWVFTNEAYTLTWIPFALNMIAMDPPFGEDIDSTVLFTTTATNAPVNQTSMLAGSADPAVDLQLIIKDPGTLTSIEVKNTTTSTSTSVTKTFTADDVLQIKTADQFVGVNGLPVSFEGNVVRFDPGVNNWRINYTTSDSYVIVTEQKTQNSERLAFGTLALGQKFTVASTMVIGRLDLMLAILGAPPAASVRIYSDTSFNPTNTPIATATITDPIGQTASFVPVEFASNVQLTAGSYWIVLYAGNGTTTASGDINNGYYWKGSTLNPYAGGNAARLKLSSTTVTNESTYDFAFRLFQAQTGDLFTTETADTINETFANATYMDPSGTTMYGGGGYVWATYGYIRDSTGA